MLYKIKRIKFYESSYLNKNQLFELYFDLLEFKNDIINFKEKINKSCFEKFYNVIYGFDDNFNIKLNIERIEEIINEFLDNIFDYNLLREYYGLIDERKIYGYNDLKMQMEYFYGYLDEFEKINENKFELLKEYYKRLNIENLYVDNENKRLIKFKIDKDKDIVYNYIVINNEFCVYEDSSIILNTAIKNFIKKDSEFSKCLIDFLSKKHPELLI